MGAVIPIPNCTPGRRQGGLGGRCLPVLQCLDYARAPYGPVPAIPGQPLGEQMIARARRHHTKRPLGIFGKAGAIDVGGADQLAKIRHWQPW